MDQPQADQPNSLAGGLPLQSNLIWVQNLGTAKAGALACTCSLFPLVVTTRQRRAAASSSRSSVGGGCELAEACGMQL
eukprot:962755-Pelagomonas_calceolata.AAC.1